MAKTSNNEERITWNINENDHNSNRKTRQSEDMDIQTMLHRLERALDRRNTIDDTSAISTNPHPFCQNHCYHQLAERVRELEQLTPCSNISGGSFPMNLLSPNSPVPTQPFGLSPKILERAHQIPERFWMDWQQKQMQNNLPSSDRIDASNRRKSLLLLHQLQRRMSAPRSRFRDGMVSDSIETETSSSPTDSVHFDQRSISHEPLAPKSPSTLDRSRLTIFIPFPNTNLSREKSISTASSIEDVAQIDTELKLLFLSRENPHQTDPFLYSSAILHRSTAFRSSSKPKTRLELFRDEFT